METTTQTPRPPPSIKPFRDTFSFNSTPNSKSPSPNQDRVLKLEMYRRCGVREYWIVAPEEEAIEQHVLDSNGQYLVTRYADAGVKLPLATIPDVTVSLVSIWED